MWVGLFFFLTEIRWLILIKLGDIALMQAKGTEVLPIALYCSANINTVRKY